MTSSNRGEDPPDRRAFGGQAAGEPSPGSGDQPRQPDYPTPGGATPFTDPPAPQHAPGPGQPSPQQPHPQNSHPQSPYGQPPQPQTPYSQQPYPQNSYPQSPYGQPPQPQTPYGQDPYGEGGYPPPQPPPGYYGAPPAAAPPAGKSRKWLWFLLAVPLLLLLAIGGCTALLLNAVSGPIDATNAFVAELDEGDYQAAYASLCRATRASIGAEEWILDIEAGLGGEITGYNFTNVSVEGTGDGSIAAVTGTIEVDGRDQDTSFGLVQENGQWQVCTTD